MRCRRSRIHCYLETNRCSCSTSPARSLVDPSTRCRTRSAFSTATARSSSVGASTTRPTPSCARAGSRCIRRRTGRRPARSPPPWRSATQDWLFPTYRDSVARHRPRRRPGRRVGAAARATGTAATTRPHTGRAAGDPARHPAAARRRLRPRGDDPRRGHRRARDVRRRRHQRGRLPRGAELRRRLPPARSSSSCRTTSTRSPCRWRARPPRRRSRTRPSATACPGSGSTATTSPPCSSVLGAAVDAARVGRRADAGRGAHLPRCRRTPTPTTPPATATTTRCGPGSSATRSLACAPT